MIITMMNRHWPFQHSDDMKHDSLMRQIHFAENSSLCRLPPMKSPDCANITAHRGTQSAEYGQAKQYKQLHYEHI